MSGRRPPDARRGERIELKVGGLVRCGEPEIGVSDSTAETSDGAAQEREKRGFGGGGEKRLLRETRRVSGFPGLFMGFYIH
jgi:hypothetical protein